LKLLSNPPPAPVRGRGFLFTRTLSGLECLVKQD
jgi:hypothetical protein